MVIHTVDSKNSGRHYVLADDTPIENYIIFYIGCESLTLTNIIMTYNKCKVSIKK